MAVPGKVAGVVITPAAHQLTITWNVATGTVLWYNVYIGSGTGLEILVGSTGSGVRTYTETGLSVGQTRYVQINAHNLDGNGTKSDELFETTYGIEDQNPLHYANDAMRITVFELSGAATYTLPIPVPHKIFAIVAKLTDSLNMAQDLNVLTDNTAKTVKVYKVNTLDTASHNVRATVFWY